MKKYLIILAISFLSCACGCGSGSGGQDSPLNISKWTKGDLQLTSGDELVDIIWSEKLSQFISVGGDTISSSPDGLNWTSQYPGSGWGLTGVTFNSTQNKLVAVGYWGAVAASVNNGTWSQRASLAGTLSSVASSENLYVAVGDDGTDGAIFTSSDGESWGQVNIPESEYLNRVIWNGSQFAAVGSGGAIFTSSEGTVWEKRISGTGNCLNSIAWNGSFFIAVGDSGTALKSIDGITWNNISSPELGFHLGEIIWSGTHFVVITIYDKYIFVSANGEDATPVNTNSDAGMFFCIACNGNRFVILGSPQTVITSP